MASRTGTCETSNAACSLFNATSLMAAGQSSARDVVRTLPGQLSPDQHPRLMPRTQQGVPANAPDQVAAAGGEASLQGAQRPAPVTAPAAAQVAADGDSSSRVSKVPAAAVKADAPYEGQSRMRVAAVRGQASATGAVRQGVALDGESRGPLRQATPAAIASSPAPGSGMPGSAGSKMPPSSAAKRAASPAGGSRQISASTPAARSAAPGSAAAPCDEQSPSSQAGALDAGRSTAAVVLTGTAIKAAAPATQIPCPAAHASLVLGASSARPAAVPRLNLAALSQRLALVSVAQAQAAASAAEDAARRAPPPPTMFPAQGAKPESTAMGIHPPASSGSQSAPPVGAFSPAAVEEAHTPGLAQRAGSFSFSPAKDSPVSMVLPYWLLPQSDGSAARHVCDAQGSSSCPTEHDLLAQWPACNYVLHCPCSPAVDGG